MKSKNKNKKLELFRNGWNHHKIRTAHHRTPNQLWLGGMLDHQNSRHRAVSDIFSDTDVTTPVFTTESTDDEQLNPQQQK